MRDGAQRATRTHFHKTFRFELCVRVAPFRCAFDTLDQFHQHNTNSNMAPSYNDEEMNNSSSPTSVTASNIDQHGFPKNDNGDEQSSAASTYTVQLQVDVAATLAAQRFPAWMALTVFSIICLVALQSRRGIFDVDNGGEAWVLVVTILSFIIALIMVGCYLVARSLVVGQAPELVLVALLLALWSAGLPTIMNPDNDIAVSNPTTAAVAPVVTNANLYLFAWLSFSMTIYLTASIGQEWFHYSIFNMSGLSQDGTNVPVRTLVDPSKVARWAGCLASMMVVLGAAIRTFQTANCRNFNPDDMDADEAATKTEFCQRTKFAIALGLVGLCKAFGMLCLLHVQRRALSLCTELSVATLQLLLWCFGVGYITFGRGPGSTIGNLYLGTWISFILAVVIFAVSFREWVARRATAAAAATEHNGNTNSSSDNDDPYAPGNTNNRPPELDENM